MSPAPPPFRSSRSLPSAKRPSPGRTLFAVATVLTIAWGAFAFGAVYPWAYASLAAACAVVGGVGLATGDTPIQNRWLFVGLGLVFALGLLQLVPLPPSVLSAVSPATDRFLRTYDIAYAVATRPGPDGQRAAASAWHAISLVPRATTLALGLLAAFTLFLAGLLRTMSRGMALRLARGLVLTGVVLALVGIVQKALLGDNAYAGMKIYGFWAPRYVLTTPFGPFVNKNHFAGWMLMVVPLAFGLVMGAIERHADRAGSGFRQRLVWLAGADGGKVLTLVFAALIMSLSLVMTRSRSGLGCLVAIAALVGLAARRRLAGRRGLVVFGLIGLFLVVALAWAGADTAVGRLTTGSDSVELRLRIWRATLAIARDFPLFGTGLDTFGTAMIVYQPAPEALHYQEAHNDYLQLLTEGGGALLLAVAVCALAIARGIRDRFRAYDPRPVVYWLRAGATIGLVAIALQSTVEFSLQMPGNAALFTLLLALALYAPPPASAPEPHVRVR